MYPQEALEGGTYGGTATTKSKAGRKMKSGRLVFTRGGKTGVLVDYCPCCNEKVVISMEDAREFAHKVSPRHTPVWRKAAIKVLQRLEA